ncbi:MAG: hypothetical protein ABIO70_06025 [Pseudomonadota bacterium]
MLFLVALLAGCASDNDISRLGQIDTFLQEGTDRVDVLWVVDDSISMSNEQEKVAAGFQQFIVGMNMSEYADFHMGIVTTDMDLSNPNRGLLVGDPPYLTRDDPYVGAFMERVMVGTEGSDKERGLQAAWAALTDPDALAHNGDFIREDAELALVFVSDENDCSDENWLDDEQDGALCYNITDKLVPTAEYIRQFQGLKGPGGRVVASAIIGPPVNEGCEHSWPGKRYEAVAQELEGVQGNICESDYQVIMDEIGAGISAPQRTFYLTYPAIEETLVVEVDSETVDPDGGAIWAYDPEYAKVDFTGEYVPEFGTTIDIAYDIAPSR